MKAPIVSSSVKTPEDKASPSETAVPLGKTKPKSSPVEKESKGKTVKKEEKEKKKALSEEQTTSKPRMKSPSVESKKTTPEKIKESPETKQTKKASAGVSTKRSPSSSPTATSKSMKSPKSPPATTTKKGKETAVSPKEPSKDKKEERKEDKKKVDKKKHEKKEDKKEELTTPDTKLKPKVKVTIGKTLDIKFVLSLLHTHTLSFSLPLYQLKEVSTPVTQPPEKVTASQVVVTSAPHQEKEAEVGEVEMEESPVRITKSVKRTPFNRSVCRVYRRDILLTEILFAHSCLGSRKRKAEEEGPSVESTDTEEEIPSSAQTSAVPSPSPSLW